MQRQRVIGEVREVAADAGPVVEAAAGGAQRVGVLIVEGDVIVHEVDDRLHPRPAGAVPRTVAQAKSPSRSVSQ